MYEWYLVRPLTNKLFQKHVSIKLYHYFYRLHSNAMHPIRWLYSDVLSIGNVWRNRSKKTKAKRLQEKYDDCGKLKVIYIDDNFWQEMLILLVFIWDLFDILFFSFYRYLTVLLGIFALDYLPISFTETVKSTAPAFTVIISRVLLGK